MQKTVLRVLISSPSDVQAERELADRVVDSVNAILGSDSTVLLQSIMAERDIPPGVGSDPQDVINRALPAFEIFVGIMWTRVGTPTPRAVSGTVEEFEAAIDRVTGSRGTVKVMFFFSKRSPPLDAIDTDQLANVRSFQASLVPRGVYWKEYQDEEQFRSLLTTALAQSAIGWPGPDFADASEPVPQREIGARASQAIAVLDEDIEDDWLDLLALQEDSAEQSNIILGRITEAIQRLGTRIRDKAEEMQRLNENGSVSPKRARRIVNEAATELDIFSGLVDADLPSFQEVWSGVLDRLPRIVSKRPDADTPDALEAVRRAREQVAELCGTVQSTNASLQGLRDSIARTPRLTGQYKRAARRALSALDSLSSELSKIAAFLIDFGAEDVDP